jgi:carbon monoxide dehydrogenase subunit G
MRLDHEFTVPVPAAQAWPVLLDIDRIAPCMPGATITKVDGDDFEGTVKVKVGPITVTYGGTASFLEKDEAQRIAVLEARGKETRGSGTATARVTAQLFDEGAQSTRVAVTTDLSITGKPAQFGRGVMSDVGNKLLGRFADCLAGELGSGELATPAPAPADAVPASAESGVPAESQAEAAAESAATDPDSAAATTAAPASVLDAPRREAEPIDLVEAAGGAVAKRAVPVLAAAALLALLFVILRRRR